MSSERGYAASLSAVGHFSDYFTHRLTEPDAAKRARYTPAIDQRSIAAVTERASRRADEALLSDFEPINAATNLDSPLMVVRASPDVVDAHSGIYQAPFFDFLANFVIREQMFESMDVERLMRRPWRVPSRSSRSSRNSAPSLALARRRLSTCHAS
jgi:hypothetical protein